MAHARALLTSHRKWLELADAGQLSEETRTFPDIRGQLRACSTGVKLRRPIPSMLSRGADMPLTSSGYDPLWLFRWPFSGNVNERITAPWFSPSLTVNYAGDARIEDRVVTEVASYGRQLGWLTEIALALAKNETPPPDTLRRLEKASEEIKTIKKKVHPSALEAANEALDRLQRDKPAEYRKLLSARQNQGAEVA
jgi:hypothetical protein